MDIWGKIKLARDLTLIYIEKTVETPWNGDDMSRERPPAGF